MLELAFERGLLILGAGENAIRLCPPLVITRDQAISPLDALEECLTPGRRSRSLRTLDVGCGIHKQPGAIGIDRNPASRADVLCDLDRYPVSLSPTAASTGWRSM